MKIRVVLLPDDKLEKLAKETSRKIFDNFPSHFKLDETHIPHATLIAGNADSINQDKLTQILENLGSTIKSLPIKIKNIRPWDGDKTFIGLYFEEIQGFENLRAQVLKNVQSNISDIQRFLSPHITITRLKEDSDADQASSLEIPQEEFYFKYLALCEDSEHGACKRIITKVELSLNI